MDRLVKPKKEPEQPGETDVQVSNEGMVKPQADDPAENVTTSGPDKVLSDVDVNQLIKPQDKEEQSEEAYANADDKQENQANTEAENNTKAKSAKSSILNVFKRKKKEPEKTQEDADASAQSENETPAE